MTDEIKKHLYISNSVLNAEGTDAPGRNRGFHRRGLNHNLGAYWKMRSIAYIKGFNRDLGHKRLASLGRVTRPYIDTKYNNNKKKKRKSA